MPSSPVMDAIWHYAARDSNVMPRPRLRALQRLVASIQRVIDADDAAALPIRGKTVIPEIEIDAV